VALGERSYPIVVTQSYAGLPRYLAGLRVGPALCVVSHPALLRRYGRALIRPLTRAGYTVETLTIPESERSKSLRMVERVLGRLTRRTDRRVPVLLAFGGGVVGDVTGFVAAIWRRGVPYVQVPTTLLAQVDSAIGGKTGVDVPLAKNSVGAFYQPRLVVNHVGLLRSLPPRQRRSGLSEVIKYAAIADVPLLRYLETQTDACVRGNAQVDRMMVERCARIKARLVSRDERDTRGLRTALNFGHTLGHALEAATGYRRFTHGEAIAIGMVCAARLSVACAGLPAFDAQRLIALLQRVGLPTSASGVSLRAVRQALWHDKKFVQGTLRWVLLRRLGQVRVSDAVPPAMMWRAIRASLSGS
jgi:3-dehydroquinate synthase